MLQLINPNGLKANQLKYYCMWYSYTIYLRVLGFSSYRWMPFYLPKFLFYFDTLFLLIIVTLP